MKDEQLEIVWTALTALVVAVLAILSTQALGKIESVPQDAITIKVAASQWQWQFTTPDGNVVFGEKGKDELRLKKGQPVIFEVTSLDVIHSFNIPDLGVKIDAIPGRKNRVWTTAEKEGTYLVQCAEFCGLGHSKMHAWVIVE